MAQYHALYTNTYYIINEITVHNMLFEYACDCVFLAALQSLDSQQINVLDGNDRETL